MSLFLKVFFDFFLKYISKLSMNYSENTFVRQVNENDDVGVGHM